MTVQQTRAEWLKERRTGIGGSDVAALLGLSKWSTPYQLWLDKRGEAPIEDDEPEYIYWGNVLEDVVAKEYAKRTGNRVQRVNKMMRHPEHEFALANIDRAVVNPEIAGNVRWKDGRLTTDRILECKTANGFMQAMWGEVDTDEVPEYYLVQVQWYLGITRADVADLAVLIGGSDYRRYTIQRDDEIVDMLFEEGARFWKMVQSDVAPDPQTIEDAKLRWPQHIGKKSNIVDVDIADTAVRVQQLKEQQKALKKQEDDLALKLFEAFEDAEELTHAGDKIATWKTQANNQLDVKRLKAEKPEVYAEYLNEGTSRVLRFTKATKEKAAALAAEEAEEPKQIEEVVE